MKVPKKPDFVTYNHVFILNKNEIYFPFYHMLEKLK